MRITLSLALLLVSAAVLRAAPLPEAPPLSDKYLLDEADLLVVVNVRQALSSPLFKKSYEKMVADFLKQEPAAALLKESAFNPVTDLDIVYAMARGIGPKEKPGAAKGNDLLVLQGRFDAAKFDALADKAAKDGLVKIEVEKVGDTKVYRISGKNFPVASYVAVLDKGHLAASTSKGQIETALDKAAGKKKTALKNKALAEMFGKLKAGDTAAVLATADAVMGGSGTKFNPDGTREEVTGRLGDNGMEAMQTIVRVADSIKGRVAVTAKDAATARKMEEGINGGVKQGIAELEKMKMYPELLKALKTVKVGIKDATLTLEAEGDGEAVQQLILSFFMVRVSKTGPETEPKKP